MRDETCGEVRRVACDYLISTMPVKELTQLLQPEDAHIADIASATAVSGLHDRRPAGQAHARMRPAAVNGMPPDNWIYIQEPDVKLGRLQVFNNWSPALVADPDTSGSGSSISVPRAMTCGRMPDGAFVEFASRELAKIGLIDPGGRAGWHSGPRAARPTPPISGPTASIGHVRDYLDGLANVFPVGRNGMHRYNNQDHSMLAAKAAVDCIVAGRRDKTSCGP